MDLSLKEEACEIMMPDGMPGSRRVTSAGYLRFPHIHGDLVTFIADDDVWLAPAAGGRAWRGSADHAAASHPRISRDGTAIAWTSGRDGPPEAYLARIDGADGRRPRYSGGPPSR